MIDAGGPLPVKGINPLRVPYMIDLVDWHQCSAAFHDLAAEQRVEIIAPSVSA